MYRSTLADIRKLDDIPPENLKGEYTYDSMPAETIPPIGPNLLVHLTEHPEEAEYSPVLFRKLPRKLRQRLEACPQRGWRQGWGLRLREGIDWLSLFGCGLVAFLISLVFGIVWAVVQRDVQGGFGMAGMVLSFLFFSIGTVQAAPTV